tara:strand:+ start:3622 stop:3750 length:129 start_codon:yes stop_codon:yes gene_type:complete
VSGPPEHICVSAQAAVRAVRAARDRFDASIDLVLRDARSHCA